MVLSLAFLVPLIFSHLQFRKPACMVGILKLQSAIVSWGGWGVLPYMSYIGMCSPKEYGFSAVLVVNRVLILADFGHFGHK